METKISSVGKIDDVNLLFDPLRKDDTFLVLTKSGEFKMGFILGNGVILESNFDVKWNKISSIMGGFMSMGKYEKIKEAIDEQAK